MSAKKPDLSVIVVVPTQPLQEQWQQKTKDYGERVQILIINTVVKQKWSCDLLILDEVHRYASDEFGKVFENVSYRWILGLTATFERLDGKEELLKKYCPPVDTITLLEAKANGWVSNYAEYQVIVHVDDIGTLKDLNREFNSHFEFFNYDFDLAMKCVGKTGYIKQLEYRDVLCPKGSKEEKSNTLKAIKMHSAQFMRIIQARKAFINNHPKKLELARKIIQARPNSKIITFSNSVKMAESIGIGFVYTGKDSKKKNRLTMKEFASMPSGVLNSVAKLNEGLDCPGLSVAIIIGTDSSKIKAVQRTGRVIRKEDDKFAEIFNITIADSVECEWFTFNKFTVLFDTIKIN